MAAAEAVALRARGDAPSSRSRAVPQCGSSDVPIVLRRAAALGAGAGASDGGASVMPARYYAIGTAEFGPVVITADDIREARARARRMFPRERSARVSRTWHSRRCDRCDSTPCSCPRRRRKTYSTDAPKAGSGRQVKAWQSPYSEHDSGTSELARRRPERRAGHSDHGLGTSGPLAQRRATPALPVALSDIPFAATGRAPRLGPDQRHLEDGARGLAARLLAPSRARSAAPTRSERPAASVTSTTRPRWRRPA